MKAGRLMRAKVLMLLSEVLPRLYKDDDGKNAFVVFVARKVIRAKQIYGFQEHDYFHSTSRDLFCIEI